jgi:hypothetical protein
VNLNSFKKIPDYTTDKAASIQLARRIESYYHAKGFPEIAVWVEGVPAFNNKKRWEIRSNIKFDCKTIA